MADSILVEKTQGVAIVTMNRPEQLNAMNAQLGTELREAVTRMSADDDVGCIVITGAGDRAFSAGGGTPRQREAEPRDTHTGPHPPNPTPPPRRDATPPSPRPPRWR